MACNRIPFPLRNECSMMNWKHNIMGLAGETFLCGTVGLLFPTASQGQFLEQFASLERLPESGCVATPIWDEIIEAPARWIAKMDGAASCDRQAGVLWEAVPGGELFPWSEANSYC